MVFLWYDILYGRIKQQHRHVVLLLLQDKIAATYEYPYYLSGWYGSWVCSGFNVGGNNVGGVVVAGYWP